MEFYESEEEEEEEEECGGGRDRRPQGKGRGARVYKNRGRYQKRGSRGGAQPVSGTDGQSTSHPSGHRGGHPGGHSSRPRGGWRGGGRGMSNASSMGSLSRAEEPSDHEDGPDPHPRGGRGRPRGRGHRGSRQVSRASSVSSLLAGDDDSDNTDRHSHGNSGAPQYRGPRTDNMEWQIFKDILWKYDGKAPLKFAQKLFPQSFDVIKIIDWLREHRQKFLLYENNKGDPNIVSVWDSRCRLCFAYCDGTCQNPRCTYLHLCRAHISGHCDRGLECRFHHHFQDDHNRLQLRKMNLLQFTEDEILKIIRLSNLQVCGQYNHDACKYADSCTRIHVCENFVQGKCDDSACAHAHDFDSTHSEHLLGIFGMSKMDDRTKLKNLFINRRHMGPRPANAPPTRGRGHGGARARYNGPNRGNRNGNRADHDGEKDDTNSTPEMVMVSTFDDDNDTSKMPQAAPKGSKSRRPRKGSIDLIDFGNENEQEGETKNPYYTYHALSQDHVGYNYVAPEETSRDLMLRSRDDGVPSIRKPISPVSAQTRSRAKAATTFSSQTLAVRGHSDDEEFDPGVLLGMQRMSTTGRLPSAKNRHIHQANGIFICERNLHSTCSAGNNCAEHHVDVVYQWQVQVFGNWESLTLENETIEKNFCRPEKDHVVLKVKSAIIGVQDLTLQIHFSNREVMRARIISEENMTLDVRRLSTPPVPVSGAVGASLFATRWQWYYQRTSDSGSWGRYDDKDCAMLEKSFLDGKLRIEYTMGQYRYRISFNSWYQLNQTTNTKRGILRRPLLTS